MIDICPTVTATNAHTYRTQVERITEFASRIHVDFADGEFAPTKLVSPNQAWLPADTQVDLHVMYRRPADIMPRLLELTPDLVILHAEAEGDLEAMISRLKENGIHAGVALLGESQPEAYKHLIELVDHVLIFGGHLGYQGGEADLANLSKIQKIQEFNIEAELAWDGGVSLSNAKALVEAGISVLNVGGYVQKADFPDRAYAILDAKVNGVVGA